MILIDNRDYLRQQYRPLLMKLIEIEKEAKEISAVVEPSKKGSPTMRLTVDNRLVYIHSKYDPEAEASQLIKETENIGKADHVLFVGAGLGYQIKKHLQINPDLKFSIYEPNIEVLYQFLSNVELNQINPKNLQSIFTSRDHKEISYEVRKIFELVGKNSCVFSLPVYEKLYNSELNCIMNDYKKILKGKRNNIAANASFQKRWTLNSIKNFSSLLKTPNIFRDIDKTCFTGKTAILVAAGPSLSLEFQNLKKIKDDGLAYIFSVGSAINALIENGISPHAACTYDPSEKNQIVFQKMKEKNIKEVPMIYGSSVGFETLDGYPGKMLHMITNQDSVSTALLHNINNDDIVIDSPSISIITFQMLLKLGFKEIILVGQNLAYREDRRYSTGIEYSHIGSSLTEYDLENSITIKDVMGNEVITNEGFNQMREQLELFINGVEGIKVINTTIGGAHIKGTEFINLSDVIEEKLVNKKVVRKDWYEGENSYNTEHTKRYLKKLEVDYTRCERLIISSANQLKKIEKCITIYNGSNAEIEFLSFDKEFKKLQKNLFYKIFIEPMLKVENERLSEASRSVRYQNNPFQKGEKVIREFGVYLDTCKVLYNFLKPHYSDLKESINFGDRVVQ